MIKKHNTTSLIIGIPGLFVQIAGIIIGEGLLTIIGSVLLLIGFAFYAKAKGRSAFWCLWGGTSILGVIVLGCLKDKTIHVSSEIAGKCHEISLVIKFILVINCLIFWFPFIGVILAIAGLLGTLKHPSVWRVIAIIFLALSIMASVGLLLYSGHISFN